MSPSRQYWFDYWLFLHGDDTPPWHWPRCLNSHVFLDLLKHFQLGKSYAIRECLTFDVNHYLDQMRQYELCPRSVGKIPSNLDIQLKPESIIDEIVDFFDRLSDSGNHFDLVIIIVRKIEQSILSNNLTAVKELSILLANEISFVSRDRKNIFIKSANFWKLNPNFEIINLVENIFYETEKTERFEIKFKFMATEVSSEITTGSHDVNSGMIFHFSENPDFVSKQANSKKRLLQGLTIKEISQTFSDALQTGLDKVRSVLEHLRIQHYIRTHLVGSIDALRISDGLSIKFSLDKPFWTARSGTLRKIPAFPKQFEEMIEEDLFLQTLNWTPCRWHISRAIANWGEDIHAASSSVWQSIESLSGEKSQIKQGIMYRFMRASGQIDISFAAVKIVNSKNNFLKLGGCDWNIPNKFSVMTLQKAREEVNLKKWKTWKIPYFSKNYFDNKLGFLADVCDNSKIIPNYIDRRSRVDRDLDFLYSVRNAISHSGIRLGTARWVGYLATLGLEVIFATAQELETPDNWLDIRG